MICLLASEISKSLGTKKHTLDRSKIWTSQKKTSQMLNGFHVKLWLMLKSSKLWTSYLLFNLREFGSQAYKAWDFTQRRVVPPPRKWSKVVQKGTISKRKWIIWTNHRFFRGRLLASSFQVEQIPSLKQKPPGKASNRWKVGRWIFSLGGMDGRPIFRRVPTRFFWFSGRIFVDRCIFPFLCFSNMNTTTPNKRSPGDSKWPFYPLVLRSLNPIKGSQKTIPKRSRLESPGLFVLSPFLSRNCERQGCHVTVALWRQNEVQSRKVKDG